MPNDLKHKQRQDQAKEEPQESQAKDDLDNIPKESEQPKQRNTDLPPLPIGAKSKN